MMLKVLAIVPNVHVFGLQVATLNFFKFLDRERISSRFLLTHWSDREFGKRLNDLGIPYDVSYLGFISKQLDWSSMRMTLVCLLRLPQLFVKLIWLMRRHRFDVIYVSGYHLLVQIFPVMFFWRKPIVFHVHDCHLNTAFYRSLYRLLDRIITRYVVVSEEARSRMRELGIADNKIDTVYNGVDLSAFDLSKPASDIFRKHYGWPSSMRLVAFVGQIAEHKGPADFVEAARIISERRSDVKFLIVGEMSGDYCLSLRRRVVDLGLDGQVIFCGFQKNVADVFGSIDVLVVPSRCDEAFGLVAAEAMSAMKPVIVTKSGALAELVVNEQQGLIIEKEDVDGMCDAILTLLDDAVISRKMGEAGRERVEKLFSIQTQARLLEKSFFRVAEKQPVNPFLESHAG